MKVKSKTDVITNSSSEVYCVITSPDSDVIKSIYSKLKEYWDSDIVGDGGLIYKPTEDPKKLTLEIGNEALGSGVWDMAQYGFKRFLEIECKGLEYDVEYE